MKVRSGRLKAILVVLSLLVCGTQVQAGEAFLPLSELRPGMAGYGLTVFTGTQVEAFPVEIVGILEGSGSVAHLILIKFTGEETLAAGMSGSPVFIGDRLIGAIGYGFQNTDHRYAVVTPIEEMLTLWSKTASGTYEFIEGELSGFNGVVFGEEPSGGSWLQARPVATPLFLSGYGPRAGQYLLKVLEEQGAFTLSTKRGGASYGLRPTFLPLTAAKAPKASAESPPLQPGSAFALTLVEGDYTVNALGTLTWREGQEFLGFGHPFMNRGPVEFGVGGAEIVRIIDSQDLPFKLGKALPCSGRITQDRGAGVAGEIGVLPRMVEVTTEVTDVESGLVRNYAFTVVNEEDLLPGLVLAGVLDAIDRTLDRIGSGTATVYFELEGGNFTRFQRENLFCGPDVAAAALQELAELLRVITGNEFVHPELTSVKVRVKVSPELLRAKILQVELPKTKFAPGEKVILTVHLLPFRGEVVQTPLEVELPKTPGEWVLMVYGSEHGYVTGEQGSGEEELYNADWYQSGNSLEERLADYRARIQNNQLVAEFLPAERGRTPELTETRAEDPAAAREEAPEGGPTRNYQTMDTPYFVVGEEQISIEILPSPGPNAPLWLRYEAGGRIEDTE